MRGMRVPGSPYIKNTSRVKRQALVSGVRPPNNKSQITLRIEIGLVLLTSFRSKTRPIEIL